MTETGREGGRGSMKQRPLAIDLFCGLGLDL